MQKIINFTNVFIQTRHYLRERKRYEDEVTVHTQRVNELKQKYMTGKRAYDAKVVSWTLLCV